MMRFWSYLILIWAASAVGVVIWQVALAVARVWRAL